MRYFALYHDRTRLHDVDVMSEEQVKDLALHYKKTEDFDNTNVETTNDTLDFLLKNDVCVRIEELLPSNEKDLTKDGFYLKDKEEVI